MTTLDELQVGECGVVETISGDDLITARLYEMGLTPGCHATVIGSALLGDPIEIEIRNYRLSIRKSEANRIVVGRLEQDAIGER